MMPPGAEGRLFKLMKYMLALLAVFNMAAFSRADMSNVGDPDDLRLVIAVDGPRLVFTFTNLDKSWIKIMTHMDTDDGLDYDDLTLLAVDAEGIVHPLRLMGDARSVASADYQVIKPGKSYSEKINLVAWNRQSLSQYKFRDGTDYTFILVYNDKDWEVGPHFGTIYSTAIRVRYAGGKFTAKK